MILIEGPDGVGKTTLAKKLVEILNKKNCPVVYRHNTRFPKCFNTVVNCKQQFEPNVVMDRSYPSRFCYGNTFKDQPPVSEYEFQYLNSCVRATPGIIIYIVATEKYLEATFGNKEELYAGELEKIIQVNEEYKKLALGRNGCDFYVEVDITEMSFEGKPVFSYPTSENIFLTNVTNYYLNLRDTVDNAYSTAPIYPK